MSTASQGSSISHETRSTLSDLHPASTSSEEESCHESCCSPAPPADPTKGVKGADIYTAAEVGDPRVALSTRLVRGAEVLDILDGMTDCFDLGTDESITDIALLAFQTRDVRGGKGERELFYRMYGELTRVHKTLGIALLELIPEYGSWRDMFYLAEFDSTLLWSIMAVAKKQLEADEAAMAAGKSVSLLAKWAPREGDELAGAFAWALAGFSLGRREEQWKRVTAAEAAAAAGQPALKTKPFPKHSAVMSHYRKRVAKLNTYLKTVETFECAGRWDEIEPRRVPARARQKKIAAYLNEALPSRGDKHRGPRPLRCPEDPKRMACRAAFKSFFAAATRGEVKISGSDTMYPHELVKKAAELVRLGASADAEQDSLNAVWTQMVAKANEGGGLGSTLFMCDFSGSMEHTPGSVAYWVSMAMGLLGAASAAPHFKGRFLTFDSTPMWASIPPDATTLMDQVRFLSRSREIGQGLSTDFQAAGEKILAELKAARAPPGSAPKNLIVVTDMGFDQACSSSQTLRYTGATYRHNVKTAPHQTHVQMLREAFRRASEDVHGDPDAWPAPRIVIWNVAASYSDNHQAKADEEGVLTLSGWSPSLFKVICEEGPRATTPYEGLRVQLDHTRYDAVRERCREWLAGGWRGVD